MNSKRIDYIDMAKGVGILFVVTYHTLSSMMASDPKAFIPYVLHYMVTIALPIFFIASGMLAYLKRDKEVKQSIATFIAGKAKGLLVPYISFSIIVLIDMIIERQIGTGSASNDEIRNGLLYFLTFRGFSVFWFLPSLFVGEIIFYVILKELYKNEINKEEDKRGKNSSINTSCAVTNVVMAVITIVLLTVSDVFSASIWDRSLMMQIIGCILMTLGRGVLAACFIWVGYYVMHWLLKIPSTSRKLMLIPGVLFLVLNYPLGKLAGGINVNYMIFHHSYWFFIAAVVGSLGVILICYSFEKDIVLRYCGKNSLVIMGTHMDFKVLALAIGWAYKLLKYIPRAKVIALYGLVALFIAIMELIWIFVFNKFLYKLIGR